MFLASQRPEDIHNLLCRFYNTVRDADTFPIPFERSYLNRIWDVEHKRKQKTVIVVKSKERGTRTKVTACAYSTDARIIAGGK